MKKEEKNKFSKIGKEGEEFVNKLAKATFLKDWCLVSTQKPEDDDELCDLLIVFDSLKEKHL